jgi:hypothetical protein
MEHRIAYVLDRRLDAITPAWLDWLKGIGYTGLYLEADPRDPRRTGNLAQFMSQFRLLFLYDLAWGSEREVLRRYVRDACRLAHARGLKVYLALWEPRLPMEAWALLPEAWRGVGGYDRDPISWCLGEPAAREGFTAMAAEAFAAIAGPDGIDGLKMGTHDSFSHLCSERCPRCRERSEPQQMADLFASLATAADRAGLHRPDFDYVLYTWWWREGCVDAVAKVMAGRRVTVLGRSTQGLPQYWEGRELGRTFDMALGQQGVSPMFGELVHDAHRRGWQATDMTPFGHAFEYFWFPYTPAPNRVAERLAALRELGCSGWFDYDCGGVYPGINTEIIRGDARQPGQPPEALVRQTLTRLYGEAQLPAVGAAYAAAEEALACRPIAYAPKSVDILSGRNWLELAIALPFDADDITGCDQHHRVMWFAVPNFLTSETVPVLLPMYEAAARHWTTARERFAALRAQDPAWAPVFEWEQRVVRAHELATGSAVRYLHLAANRLARGQCRLSAADERARLLPLLEAELAAAAAFTELWRADHRLLNNPLWRLGEILQTTLPWTPLDTADPFATKLAHTRDQLARLRAGQPPLDSVPAWPR